MVEAIMFIGGINFLMGFLFEKAVRIAVQEWKEASVLDKEKSQ